MLSIRSNDGPIFVVGKAVANMSGIVRGMLDDLGDDVQVELPNVTKAAMARTLEYCINHQRINDATVDAAATKQMGHDLMAEISHDMSALLELTNVANYLDIEELRDAACDFLAQMIDGKSTEEIRVLLNMASDFSEEEELAMQNDWLPLENV